MHPVQTIDSLRVRIDDEERLAALQSYRIMDTAPEPNYERLVDLVHAVCQGAWTSVTFVDRDRLWFKAVRGFDQREVPRAVSFCSVSMQQLAPLIVEDALLDARFKDNGLVKERGLRFFAGYPMFSSDGYGLGSVCVLSLRPRTLLASQLDLMERARNWVQADLERRRNALEWKDGAGASSGAARKLGEQRQALKKFNADQAWEAFIASGSRPTFGNPAL